MNKIQVDPHHYSESYDTEERFISYWHQINEIVTKKPRSILEIGIGNGFVSNYLKHQHYNIHTMDIDNRLHPDIVGDLLDMPVEDKSYDMVVCFEVLEHLPYNNFVTALREMKRVSKKYVILSLPNASRFYRIFIEIPRLGTYKNLFYLPRFHPPEHIFDGQHYWEIGKKNYPLKRIRNDIAKAGLYISNSYGLFEHPYHYFLSTEIRNVADAVLTQQ